MWPIVVVGTAVSGVSMLPYILNERSDACIWIFNVIGRMDLQDESFEFFFKIFKNELKIVLT